MQINNLLKLLIDPENMLSVANVSPIVLLFVVVYIYLLRGISKMLLLVFEESGKVRVSCLLLPQEHVHTDRAAARQHRQGSRQSRLVWSLSLFPFLSLSLSLAIMCWMLDDDRRLSDSAARESDTRLSLLLRRASHLPHQELHHQQGPAQAHPRPPQVQTPIPRFVYVSLSIHY